jgi:hypothetical protein
MLLRPVEVVEAQARGQPTLGLAVLVEDPKQSQVLPADWELLTRETMVGLDSKAETFQSLLKLVRVVELDKLEEATDKGSAATALLQVLPELRLLALVAVVAIAELMQTFTLEAQVAEEVELEGT